MSDYVFAGPSVSAADVDTLLPGARRLPPITHGDLIRLDPKPGDRVLIVDGLFMQRAPVRHREILDVLQRGVTVGGSSSMGALRAAELWRFGMRGVGRVFDHFATGVIRADDEVAMSYGPAEDGYPALSTPLVELRLHLADAVREGVLAATEAAQLLELVRALPFRQRSVRVFRRLEHELPAARAFLRSVDATADDVKHADAVELLARCAAGDLVPHNDGDWAIRHVATHHQRRWQARHRGVVIADRFVPDADAVAIVLALHPQLPALHRRRTLATVEHRAGLAHEDGWLTPSEALLPSDERAQLVIARAFGTRICATLARDVLPDELAGDDVLVVARRFAAAAARANDKLPRAGEVGSGRLFFRADAIDALFTELWQCEPSALTAHAQDRGFLDLMRLRAVMEPFVALLHAYGPPVFPAVGERAHTGSTEQPKGSRISNATDGVRGSGAKTY